MAIHDCCSSEVCNRPGWGLGCPLRYVGLTLVFRTKGLAQIPNGITANHDQSSSIGFQTPQRLRNHNFRSALYSDSTSVKKRPQFHDYFVTHLPSSSLHPDPRGPTSPFHKLPRSAFIPHTGETPHPPTAFQTLIDRETTVVRIPLRSAKHHFGAITARGTRPANEDTYQAGVIDIPAFAKRHPASLTINRTKSADVSVQSRESRGAETASGDPQVFYFGIFDGHGGSECSTFLKENLHEYVQTAAMDFELCSSLRTDQLQANRDATAAVLGSLPVMQNGNRMIIGDLEKNLVSNWRRLVGGYFKRFKPRSFAYHGSDSPEAASMGRVSIEEVMEYAFLRADLDFVKAQAAKRDDDLALAEKPLNEDEILHSPSLTRTPKIGGRSRFKGGSTGSVAMISTPTPTPFWHPAGPSSLLVSHVGDTRILLCSTATGEAIPHYVQSPSILAD